MEKRPVAFERCCRLACERGEDGSGSARVDVQAVRVDLYSEDRPFASSGPGELMRRAASRRCQRNRERQTTLPVHDGRLR